MFIFNGYRRAIKIFPLLVQSIHVSLPAGAFFSLYHSYLSAFIVSAGVPNGEFPEILIENVGQDFIVLDFFHGRRFVVHA
jgi:hypothetical protein